MITIKEVLKKSEDFFQGKGIVNARRQAEEVIADVLDLPRIELYMQFDRPIEAEELDRCRSVIERRGKGEPNQYIRGFVEFHDCKIYVDPRVLIPRQETEVLVDLIAKDLENRDLQGKVLWDVCTGSGCIGISLKKKFPELDIVLSDLSQEALMLARQNAAANEVDVSFIEGDLLQPFSGKKADYVVCNPPYIANHEFDGLEREVRDFEPKQALISGQTGLEFYQRLSKELPDYLNPEAKAWFEIGEKQGKAVKTAFHASKWKKVEYQRDWSDNDRFFFLEIE